MTIDDWRLVNDVDDEWLMWGFFTNVNNVDTVLVYGDVNVEFNDGSTAANDDLLNMFIGNLVTYLDFSTR